MMTDNSVECRILYRMKLSERTTAITGITLLCVIFGALFLMHDRMPAENTAHLTDKNTPVSLATTTPEGKPFQYVVFAFDGSRSLEEWRETLDFAKNMNQSGVPIHFTYFINAIYLMPENKKDTYHPPHNPVGTSLIGYGASPEEVGQRISLINEAYESGHEIGSHGVGHIPGYGWTKEDWISELSQFNAILDRARNGIDTTVPLRVPASAIQGFRSPDLVTNSGLDEALDGLGYKYDTSHTTRMGMWPKHIGKHWEMSLASIPHEGKHDILSMDYNFYISDSDGKDTLQKDTPLWHKKHDEMLASYMSYFTAHYMSNRAPIFIGHHFSDWNDGLYWSVMQDAVKAMCAKQYVRCATHQETMNYMN